LQSAADAAGAVRFSADCLRLDAAAEVDRICGAIRGQLRTLKRRGAVLGLSGGIDSSVCAALCARAIGAERVIALLMPEADSADESTPLGHFIAAHLGIRAVLEDITPIVEAAGCYSRRDAAIQAVIPEYGPGYKSKIVLPSAFDNDGYKLFSVVVQSSTGLQIKARLTADAYLGIVAATSFKQRVRKMMEYHHADRLQYAVVGTPNRLEYDQGFFVKNGDGAADLKPIAHLYKTQVYQLAEYLGIPDEIRRRPPTTDTYSLEQSQEEFYFSVPFDKLDLCLYGLNHGIAARDVAPAVGLTPDQVDRVYRDIGAKRRATDYLHQPPLLVDAVFPTDAI
jgi:NAD+ synthase